jgi:hypothetical protein
MWEKNKLIFNQHHAQLPVVDELTNFYRIYYSTRIDGKSTPMFIDIDKEDFSKIIKSSKGSILNLGKLGSFDWAGVMPTEIITKNNVKYLYYIGWSLRQDVPYHNSLGLAISYDDGETWNKFSEGPIFNTSHLEPGFIGTVSIINDENKWRMWYLSCRNWFEYENRVEPTYDIKYAESEDGINWVPKNLTCVGLDDDEGGISSQRILKLDDKYHMWYSIRKKTKYRNNIQNSYRIKKSISDDGLNWKKLNNIEIDVGAEDSWDSDMTCYPFIIQNKKKFIIFYNGNGFGKTGIGYATNFIVE